MKGCGGNGEGVYTIRGYSWLCGSTEAHPGDVNLADHVFMWNIFVWFGDEDAFALASCVRLTDVRLVLLGPGVSLEVTVAVTPSQEGSSRQEERGQVKWEREELTLREGTTFWGRCCSLWETASACGSCSWPESPCGRFRSSPGNGWFSAETKNKSWCLFIPNTKKAYDYTVQSKWTIQGRE